MLMLRSKVTKHMLYMVLNACLKILSPFMGNKCKSSIPTHPPTPKPTD